MTEFPLVFNAEVVNKGGLEKDIDQRMKFYFN